MSTRAKNRTADRQGFKEWQQTLRHVRETSALNEAFQTQTTQNERIARAKKDYAFFVTTYLPSFANAPIPNFHLTAARRVLKNKRIRLWLQWGRGLAKSVLGEVTLILWLWIQYKVHFLVLIGENADKAEILLEDLRAQLEANQRLIHDFGEQHNPGQWEKGFFITKNGLIAKSLGLGQSPRGLRVGSRRPDFIVCDDWETRLSVKNPKRQREMADWLLREVIPTCQIGKLRVLLLQNKFAPSMIFDHVIEKGKGWKVMRVNAYNPVTYEPAWKGRDTARMYREMEGETIGILAARAEYNNDPHVEGNLFTQEMIQWAPLPRIDHFQTLIGSWDVAYAGSADSDYNAVRVWGLKDGKKYLIDGFVRQSKIRDAVRWIADFQQRMPATVKVPFRFEAQFWNDEIERIIEEVSREAGRFLNLSKRKRSRVNKYERILTMHPHYQNGRVYYNEKLKSHNDTQTGIAQLMGIEPGYRTHDDAPDADQYAFEILDQFSHQANGRYRIQKREQRHY